MPKFSVIMQCFLGEYQGCATNREEKLIRAVDSVLKQTFKDWELIVVADGCEKTFDLIYDHYHDVENISCILIEKQTRWSGGPRDIGKLSAKGEFCIYLDSDDYYADDYLERINNYLSESIDWVWMNDFTWNGKNWIERQCKIRVIGYNGTSNVCFRRSLDVNWSVYTGYAHDFYFNQQLLKHTRCAKIPVAGYYVCHLPPHPGGVGYEI